MKRRAFLKMLAAAAVLAVLSARSEEREPLLTGGDISALPKLESLGAVYRLRGEAGDALQILRTNGSTCFRVRLFVNPTLKEVVVQDLPFAVKLGQRVKATGARLLLDLHYSDTWADPQKQTKPAAWTNLTFAALEQRVESYTAEVVTAFRDAGCLPDIVQIGNEITPGILWPEGKIGAPEGGWDNFAALLKAGLRGARKTLQPQERVELMLHVDCGGNGERTRWFFDHLRERQVAFDLIGLSYYPWWHGGLNALRANLAQTAARYGKPIIVVETAYPWRQHQETKNMDWPMTPQGQARFLRDVIEAVRDTPDRLGRGVIWWYPESVKTPGLHVWKNGDVALFDERGEALPAQAAFSDADVSRGLPERAVAGSLDLIRACQLGNGAFVQVTPGGNPKAPVWIAPYFADYAALALLAEYARAKRTQDLDRVTRWLEWCAAHQHRDGYWNDFEGTAEACRDTGKVDAWDSSAALFLMVAGRYRSAGGTPSPAVMEASKKALACIGRVTDADGLTWAKPDYRMKFLMDNVEVRSGLRAASALFEAEGARDEAAHCRQQADRLSAKLQDFWRPDANRFAYVLRADGTFESGLDKAYPHGLAQLFGIAFVAPKAAAWRTVCETFWPETGPATAFGEEWWLCAAAALNNDSHQTSRVRLSQKALAFNPKQTHLHRRALAVLALLEGPEWMCK